MVSRAAVKLVSKMTSVETSPYKFHLRVIVMKKQGAPSRRKVAQEQLITRLNKHIQPILQRGLISLESPKGKSVWVGPHIE